MLMKKLASTGVGNRRHRCCCRIFQSLSRRFSTRIESRVSGVGEGAGVFGRAAAGRDVERGGAWQPSLPQDAEDGIPGSDAAGDRGPAGAGPAAGAARPRPGPDDQDLAQGEGGVMREPGILATLSKKTETIARLPGNLGSNPSAAALK